jgi:hypothetical protein
MSRRRERANFDGSMSLVRQSHAVMLGEDPETTLVRLAKIMEMIDHAITTLWNHDAKNRGRRVGTGWGKPDAAQKQLPPREELIGQTQEEISSMLVCLKDVQCYGLWSDAVSMCTSWTRLANGKNGEAENLATLWKEAVCTFDRIPDAHGPKFPFGAALNMAVLMKIRAIEPVVLELLAWSPWTHWRQEIPDSACVTKELRAKAKEMEEVRYKRRMEELHAPDLLSLVSRGVSSTSSKFPLTEHPLNRSRRNQP